MVNGHIEPLLRRTPGVGVSCFDGSPIPLAALNPASLTIHHLAMYPGALAVNPQTAC